jgi:hypothetical protein
VKVLVLVLVCSVATTDATRRASSYIKNCCAKRMPKVFAHVLQLYMARRKKGFVGTGSGSFLFQITLRLTQHSETAGHAASVLSFESGKQNDRRC